MKRPILNIRKLLTVFVVLVCVMIVSCGKDNDDNNQDTVSSGAAYFDEQDWEW